MPAGSSVSFAPSEILPLRAYNPSSTDCALLGLPRADSRISRESDERRTPSSKRLIIQTRMSARPNTGILAEDGGEDFGGKARGEEACEPKDALCRGGSDRRGDYRHWRRRRHPDGPAEEVPDRAVVQQQRPLRGHGEQPCDRPEEQHRVVRESPSHPEVRDLGELSAGPEPGEVAVLPAGMVPRLQRYGRLCRAVPGELRFAKLRILLQQRERCPMGPSGAELDE